MKVERNKSMSTSTPEFEYDSSVSESELLQSWSSGIPLENWVNRDIK